MGGPEVCQKGNVLQCYQPALANSLYIKVINAPPTLVSIAVTPANPSIVSGTTQQFTATGTYSDASTQNITASVTWSSSSIAAATISNVGGSKGLATGVAAGNTTITATLGLISGNTQLTVTPAVISLSSSSLTLFPSGTQRFLIVNNTSPTITATNISAILPPDWGDVTQDTSNCVSVAPLGNCQLGFMSTGSTTHAAAVVPVSGSNTTSVNATLSVSYPWVTNGSVNTIVNDNINGLIYLAGSFTLVGPNSGPGVPFDVTSGTAVSTYPRANGTISAAISDGNGGWYIGGNFTNVGGLTRNRLAHILANGSVDLSWNPNADNGVRALALNGSIVYAGGGFTNIGGQARIFIAALDASTGLATTWAPNANNPVNVLAFSGSTVYAGGVLASLAARLVIVLPPWMPARALPQLESWCKRSCSFPGFSGSTVYAGGILRPLAARLVILLPPWMRARALPPPGTLVPTSSSCP